MSSAGLYPAMPRALNEVRHVPQTKSCFFISIRRIYLLLKWTACRLSLRQCQPSAVQTSTWYQSLVPSQLSPLLKSRSRPLLQECTISAKFLGRFCSVNLGCCPLSTPSALILLEWKRRLRNVHARHRLKTRIIHETFPASMSVTYAWSSRG